MSGIYFFCRGCKEYRPRYEFARRRIGMCRVCHPPVEAKTCKTCGHDRPIDEYHVDRKARDGHRPVCKRCRNAHDRRSYAQTKRTEQGVRRTDRSENRSLLFRLIASPWA